MHTHTIVIGNGSWGKVLYTIIKANERTVSIWDRKQPITDVDTLVLCVPTQSIRKALQWIKIPKKDFIVINTAKGIEQSTHKLPYQIIGEILGGQIDYFSLIGPSFAKEVMEKMPTLVNLGYTHKKNVSIIKHLFQTDYFRIRPTKGVEVLELSAAFKNVYAIACGLGDGLGFGMNTRVKLMILALEEFYRLCKKLKLKVDMRVAPGTIGDLILTCNSEESRNFRFGKLLATHSASDSLGKIHGTVEGFYTISSVAHLTKKNKVDLPLATLVGAILTSNKPSEIRGRFAAFVKHV